MVPHVAARGSSFKGAGLYYLHDKSARTSERVDWTLTRNVPTNDPEKALKWMAYAAMTAEQIKEAHGGSRVGRKAKGKPVYSYSLSWHKDDNPSREEMQKAAFDTLERLELKDHEAVIVAHRDTDHPHVHVICNLVNPKTGRTHTARMDRIKLSEWAQEHDKHFGREHCPERTKNNLQRTTPKLQQEFTRRKGQEHTQEETRKKSFVKHRAKEDPRAQAIQELYTRSDSGKAFRAALQEKGYTLAQGHKGRIALVNEQGQVFSLARQLKGQRARDIKARLKDVEFKSLPKAHELADERQHFDRDKYAAQQQDKIEAAAIEAAKKEQGREGKDRAEDSRTTKPEAEIFDRDAYEIERQKAIVDDAIKADQDERARHKKALQQKKEQAAREERRRKLAASRDWKVGEKSDIKREFAEEVHDRELTELNPVNDNDKGKDKSSPNVREGESYITKDFNDLTPEEKKPREKEDKKELTKEERIEAFKQRMREEFDREASKERDRDHGLGL